MAEEPENPTLRILQELRADMGEMRTEMREMRADLNSRMADMSTRLNGNTILLGTGAGLYHDYEERIEKLEPR